jgi:hypothetical protein
VSEKAAAGALNLLLPTLKWIVAKRFSHVARRSMFRESVCRDVIKRSGEGE